MNTVTKASLESKIRRLEMFEQSKDGQLRLSLNEEYQLAAYRMLFDFLCNDSQVQIQGLIAALDNETLLCRRWEKRARELGWRK